MARTQGVFMNFHDTPAVERATDGRSLSYTWLIGPVVDGTGVVVLSVSHRKRAWNGVEDYFFATLYRAKDSYSGHFRVRTFDLFDGTDLRAVPAGTRFSRAKLAEAAELALARVRSDFGTPASFYHNGTHS